MRSFVLVTLFACLALAHASSVPVDDGADVFVEMEDGPVNQPLPASFAANIQVQQGKFASNSGGGNTVPIPPLNAHSYGHGAVMGSALQFANDAKWMQILSVIQPVTFARVEGFKKDFAAAAAKNATEAKAKVVSSLILFMENNPVLSGYATVEHLLLCDPTNIQLDPKRCSLPLRAEWDVWTAPTAPANVTQLKIAHGTSSTLLQQSLLKSMPIGWGKTDVIEAPTAVQWLEHFGRAINAGKDRPDGNNMLPPAQFVAMGASYLASPSGLVLDVKSTYSTSADLDALCAALKNQYGINVFGVGSFVRPQIDGMKGGVTPVHFYHSHYALLSDGLAQVVRQGDTVMFNGASLLTELTPGVYAIDKEQVAAVAAVQKQYNLRISMYTQEPALSSAAAALLVQISNDNPYVFLDGFAYGHLNGHAERFTLGSGAGAQAPLFLTEKLSLKARSAVVKVKGFIVGLFKRTDPPAQVAFAPAAPLPAGTLQQKASHVAQVRSSFGKLSSMRARAAEGPLEP